MGHMKFVSLKDSLLLREDWPKEGKYSRLFNIKLPGWVEMYLTYWGLGAYKPTVVTHHLHIGEFYFEQSDPTS